METIYLVNAETSFDGNFKVWTTYKAFKSYDKANEYAKKVIEYNKRNEVEGVKRYVYVKEVEFEG